MAVQPILDVQLPNSYIQWLTQAGNLVWARQALNNNAAIANRIGLPNLSNHISTLANNLSLRDSDNQRIYDIYKVFGDNLYNMMWDRDTYYGSLNQDLLWELSNLQRQYNDTYWPQGQMTQKVNQLYSNYGNYLLNKNAADRAYASWLANRYWLSDNARRIAESDVWLSWLAEALKIFDAETSALDNINKTFNTLNTDAFSRYQWIQNDYLKSLADSNFGVQTELAQSLLNLMINNELLKWNGTGTWGTWGWSSWSGGSSTWTSTWTSTSTNPSGWDLSNLSNAINSWLRAWVNAVINSDAIARTVNTANQAGRRVIGNNQAAQNLAAQAAAEIARQQAEKVNASNAANAWARNVQSNVVPAINAANAWANRLSKAIPRSSTPSVASQVTTTVANPYRPVASVITANWPWVRFVDSQWKSYVVTQAQYLNYVAQGKALPI